MRGCPNEPGSLFSDAQHTEKTVCCQIIRLVPGRLTFSQKTCEHPARSQYRLRVVLMPSRPFQKPHPPSIWRPTALILSLWQDFGISDVQQPSGGAVAALQEGYCRRPLRRASC
jgi:hypothetical protein